MIKLELTIEQAKAVAVAIHEHIERRGDVRHYVDTRYSAADVEFRNYKIGQVQDRFNKLNYVLTEIKLQGAEHDE